MKRVFRFIKANKEMVSPLLLMTIGVVALIVCFFYLDSFEESRVFEELKGIIRIVVALATAAVSIAFPGLLVLGKNPETKANRALSPEISASGALAVFVIVYLFNPI